MSCLGWEPAHELITYMYGLDPIADDNDLLAGSMFTLRRYTIRCNPLTGGAAQHIPRGNCGKVGLGPRRCEYGLIIYPRLVGETERGPVLVLAIAYTLFLASLQFKPIRASRWHPNHFAWMVQGV